MNNRILRLVVAACLAASVVGCTDSKAVNAAFSQNRVSWFVFDAAQPRGLRPLAGFEQAERVDWKPRGQSLYATALLPAPSWARSVAVAGLGLLLLDDADGTLQATRPGSSLRLSSYRTDRLFVWKDKLFVTLRQEPLPSDVPATLAWWSPGQSRLALYPIPSQVKDPTRQAIASVGPFAPDERLGLTWKLNIGDTWVLEQTTLNLADGSEEASFLAEQESPPVPAEFDAVRSRLAERLGKDVPFQTIRADHILAVFTQAGWVAVSKPGDGRARLYRLPDLGMAGRYTAAMALDRGFVFTWETLYRGFSGASGLVHVPFAVLAP